MSSLGIVSSKDLPGGVLHEHLREILNGQEEKVRSLIRECRIIIEKAAAYLLEKERISGDYLRELLNMEKQKCV